MLLLSCSQLKLTEDKNIRKGAQPPKRDTHCLSLPNSCPCPSCIHPDCCLCSFIWSYFVIYIFSYLPYSCSTDSSALLYWRALCFCVCMYMLSFLNKNILIWFEWFWGRPSPCMLAFSVWWKEGLLALRRCFHPQWAGFESFCVSVGSIATVTVATRREAGDTEAKVNPVLPAVAVNHHNICLKCIPTPEGTSSLS